MLVYHVDRLTVAMKTDVDTRILPVSEGGQNQHHPRSPKTAKLTEALEINKTIKIPENCNTW